LKSKVKRLVSEQDLPVCPFDSKLCSFPNGEHFDSPDFIGCKVNNYRFGNGDKILWACPRFPLNLSITAVRDIFMKFYGN